MENVDSTKMDSCKDFLAQLVENNRADLAGRCQRLLRDTLFINRAEMRPNMVKGIALEEVDALLGFLRQPAFSGIEHGAKLYRTGLGEQVIMRMGQVMRQFFLQHLENGQVSLMLELVDSYQVAVIQGFIKDLEKGIFVEQERTYQALQRVNSQA
jgi:hypothetical protein